MRKLLKISKSIIDVYNGYACTIPIYIDKLDGKRWFVQNYINYMVTYDKNYSFVIFDYFYSDDFYNTSINNYQPENNVMLPIKSYAIPAETDIDIIKVIREIIDREYYLCLFVNLKYLKIYEINEDVIHDIFIYGYDDEKRIIYSSGYIKGEKYSFIEYSYDELIEAYRGLFVDSIIHEEFDTARISFFNYNEKFCYEFDIQKFIDALYEYLNVMNYQGNISRKVYRNEKGKKWRVVYGLESIKVLIQYIKNIGDKRDLDIRQLYFFYNHKINMKYKIDYLLETGYIYDNKFLDEYEDIVKLAKVCLTYSIKFKIDRNAINLKKVTTILEEIYERERRVWFRIIEILEKYSGRK